MGVRLPAEYQEVDYLESPGLCYIKKDIQIPANGVLTANLTFQLVEQLREQWFAGYFAGDLSIMPEIGVYNGGLYADNGTRYQLISGSNWVTDIVKAVFSRPIKNVDISLEWGVFSRMTDNGAIATKVNQPPCRIYSHTVYINDDIVLDLVPCYRKSDHEPGMYDLVTGEFFTNAGTGEFLVGPDVIDSISPLMVAWRRIMMAAASVAKKLVKLIATSTTGLVSFDTNVEMPTKVTCEFSPVQEGSGDPSPDNVRPISGWTGCGVFQAQKNLFNKNTQPYRTGSYIDQSAQVGENLTSYITNNANYNIYALSLKPGQNYVFGIARASQPRMVAIDHNQKILGVYVRESNGYTTCLVPNSTEYLLFSVAIDGAYKNIDDFQVELGSVHSTYEAYHGAEIPITFTDPSTGDPMTVYGGTVTLNEDGSADLNENRILITLDGSSDEDWSSGSWGANVKWLAPSDIYYKIVNPSSSGQPYDAVANYLRPIAQSANWDTNDNYFSHTGQYIYMKCSMIGASANWRNYLAENPLTILFKLKVPVSYHFPNVGKLKAFLGTNNIWHNMNGDVTVEYWNKQ